MIGASTRALETPHGTVHFPAYVPVTTFGEKYPLDDLVRPYLPRLAPAVMVSLHFARLMKARPRLPLFVDSGGFASLFKDSKVSRVRGVGVLETKTNSGIESLHPRDVLEFQEQHADVAFTLDFPIPPSLGRREAKRRLDLTIANALWAVENRRRRDMLLFACVQGWDVLSYVSCASSYATAAFDGIAIGGLIPRLSNTEQLLSIVDGVRSVAGDRPIHVLGIGKPETVATLFRAGVQSVDSSSYVKLAADGRLWGQATMRIADASPTERLHLALCNLAMATQRSLPLSATHLLFGSPLWERGQRIA